MKIPYKDSSSSNSQMFWILLTSGTLIITAAYLLIRGIIVLSHGYTWKDQVIAFMLMLAEGFILIHGIGYFSNVLRVLKHPPSPVYWESDIELNEYPWVAVIVAAHKEPLEIVEKNLICFRNLTYPNKVIYLLDDTRYELDNSGELNEYRARIDAMCQKIGINLFRRQWHNAKAGLINDFLWSLEDKPPEGSKLLIFQRNVRHGPEKYIAIFDADMNPLPDFIEPLIKRLEADNKLSFIQTPQYYTNFSNNAVANAAGIQQAVFYEYICEGKSLQDAMFCCGTNVMFRRAALVDVGGLDESSVTEDIATSLKLHLKGWRSLYLKRISSFGMGPHDLSGYFKQQFRWALGTISLFREVIRNFIRKPNAMPLSKWWEYFLSSTYYFVGWSFAIFWICPVIYLFFNLPGFFAHPVLFVLIFVPYVLLTFSTFLFTLAQRTYRPSELLTGIMLTNETFPVYINATIQGIMGCRGSFGITPKIGRSTLPLRSIWPQILAFTISFIAIIWGANRLYYEREPAAAILVNMFWCIYHISTLCPILWFNRPPQSELV